MAWWNNISGGGGGGRSRAPQQFANQYRVYSPAWFGKPKHVEEGGKILLPQSALEALGRLNIEWPMLFKVCHPKFPELQTHCGVLEFSSPEGQCIMPHWMMRNLSIDEGGMVFVVNVSLPKGSFVQLKPHTKKFTDTPNPKVILETALRSFATLTKGEDICIPFHGSKYYLRVMDIKPENRHNAISIIETDIQLDFAPAMDADQEQTTTTTTTNSTTTTTSSGSTGVSSNTTPKQQNAEQSNKPVTKRGFLTQKASTAKNNDPFAGVGRKVSTGEKVSSKSTTTTTKTTTTLNDSDQTKPKRFHTVEPTNPRYSSSSSSRKQTTSKSVKKSDPFSGKPRHLK